MKRSVLFSSCVTLSALALFTVASPSARAQTTYMSSAAFSSAIASMHTFTEGYESLPIDSTIAPGDTVDGITYTAFPAGTLGRIDNLYNRIGNASLALQRGGDNTSFFFPGDTFTITLATPVTAIGIFFNTGISSTTSDYFITTPVGTATTGGPTYDTSTLYFAGLISSTPFTTATIGSVASANTFNVDNLTLASAPEPGTLAFLLAGSAGIMLRRRTR